MVQCFSYLIDDIHQLSSGCQRGGLFYFSIMFAFILCLYALINVACGYSTQKTQVNNFFRIKGKAFYIQGYPQRMILQRLLYRIHSVILFTFMVPFKLIPLAFFPSDLVHILQSILKYLWNVRI